MINQKLLSFDFGGKYVHIAEGVDRGRHIEIMRLENEPIPSNAVVDGRLEDANVLKTFLSDLIRQKNIGTKQVVITIQGASVIMREALLPVLSGQQLDQAVRYEMEQYLPAQVGNYITEYRILEQVTEENVKKYRIRIAALPKDIAEAYYKLLGEIRLKPVALDIHPNAVSKLFSKETDINGIYSIENKAAAIIDIGYRTISVNIFNKGILEYNRLLVYGSRDLDTSIAAYFNTGLDVAEIKKTQELNLNNHQIEEENDLSVFKSVRPVLAQWLSEIQKVLQYYNNRNPNNRVDTLFLYGGGSGLKGLDRYIRQEMNLRQVERITGLNCIKLVRNAEKCDITEFLNAIGAIRRL